MNHIIYSSLKNIERCCFKFLGYDNEVCFLSGNGTSRTDFSFMLELDKISEDKSKEFYYCFSNKDVFNIFKEEMDE